MEGGEVVSLREEEVCFNQTQLCSVMTKNDLLGRREQDEEQVV
jgi:hypothetical protein